MKTVLLSALLLFSVIASAQDTLLIYRPAFLYDLATYDFPRSYGFTIGASIPFHSHVKEKKYKDSNPRNSEKDDFISAESGGYRDRFAYTSILVNAGIGIRYVKSTKHFTELSFNQGMVRTMYDGIVYELNPNGSIQERILFGRTYLTTGFSYSQNWSLNNRSSNLWFIRLKPAAWIQYPYNSFLKPHISLQAGVSYHLKKHNSFYPYKTQA